MDTNEELQRALASGYEEAVEVNQRGLIEKILARYSGDYTVFRELLQNADDAQASVCRKEHIHQIALVLTPHSLFGKYGCVRMLACLCTTVSNA